MGLRVIPSRCATRGRTSLETGPHAMRVGVLRAQERIRPAQRFELAAKSLCISAPRRHLRRVLDGHALVDNERIEPVLGQALPQAGPGTPAFLRPEASCAGGCARATRVGVPLVRQPKGARRDGRASSWSRQLANSRLWRCSCPPPFTTVSSH